MSKPMLSSSNFSKLIAHLATLPISLQAPLITLLRSWLLTSVKLFVKLTLLFSITKFCSSLRVIG